MNKRIKLTARAIAGAALMALIGAFLLPARDGRFSTLARNAAGDPTTPQHTLHGDQEARQFKQQEMEKGLNPNRSRTAFVYQGQLKERSLSAIGVYDFRFTLHTAQAGGSELGSIVREATVLTDGMFKVELDFGGAASEDPERWLEVAVRSAGSAGAYTALSPRQRLTPTPYAIFAQREQWSLIGVPIGFAGGEDKDLVATATTPSSVATDLKGADGRSVKSADSTSQLAPLPPSGTPNYIAKFDSTGNPTADSVMFDDGSRVAIGTTTPLSTLQVHGPGGVEQAPGGNFATASVFSTNFLLPQGFGQLGLFTTDPQAPDIGGQLVLGGNDGATDRRSFAAIAGRKENNIANNRDGYLQFSVRSNVGPPFRDLQERMRITSAGAVGIGTTSPQTRLHVEAGKVYVGSAGQGVILKSPNGAICRELTINNAGGITLIAIACP